MAKKSAAVTPATKTTKTTPKAPAKKASTQGKKLPVLNEVKKQETNNGPVSKENSLIGGLVNELGAAAGNYQLTEKGKSIIGSIVGAVGNVIGSIPDLIRGVPDLISGFASGAIGIVSKIKDAFESQTAILLTEFIPGDWDDNLRKAAIELCNGFITVLDGIDRNTHNPEVKELAKQMVYQKMASAIVALQDNNSLPQNKYDTYTQIVYSNGK